MLQERENLNCEFGKLRAEERTALKIQFEGMGADMCFIVMDSKRGCRYLKRFISLIS